MLSTFKFMLTCAHSIPMTSSHSKVREDSGTSTLDNCLFGFMACCVNLNGKLGLGRKSNVIKIQMQKKLRKKKEARNKDNANIELTDKEEMVRWDMLCIETLGCYV